MKTIVTGSFGLHKYEAVGKAVEESGFDISEIVTSKRPGVEESAIAWGIDNDYPVQKMFTKREDRSRIRRMVSEVKLAEYADNLIVIWDGYSTDCDNLVKEMRERNKEVFILDLSEKEKKE